MIYCLLVILFQIPAIAPQPLTAPAAAPGLFISTDNGSCWEDFSTGLPGDVRLSEVFEHNEKLFLLTATDGLFVLSANGKVWRPSSVGLPFHEPFFQMTSIAAKGDRMVIGTFLNGIYLSDDGGASWSRSEGTTPEVTGALLFTKDRLLAGTHDGVWESLNGGVNWQPRGDFHDRINAIAEFNGHLVLARQNGLGIMSGEDIVWAEMETDWAITGLGEQGNNLYTFSPSNEIYRSGDGVNWEKKTSETGKMPATGLLSALWNGFTPVLPEGRSNGFVAETSRGWVLLTGLGC